VVGGAPGVGKSRGAVALAEAGATGYEWFGLKIPSKFKTLIVQNENGRFRLQQEFSEFDCNLLDQYVRITPPPPYGLCFDNLDFRLQLEEQIQEFDPAIVIIDPWPFHHFTRRSLV
jgi:AAA domain